MFNILLNYLLYIFYINHIVSYNFFIICLLKTKLKTNNFTTYFSSITK